MSTATTIFLGIFGGGSLITLVQFLVNRYDKKKEDNSAVIKEIKSVKTDMTELKKEVQTRFDQIDRKVDDGQAKQARARILRFSDELQTGRKFSKDSFNQTFQDISDYKAHCTKYDDFPNDQAEVAMRNVVKVHAELLERERRGEDVFL